jgi:hypothetical protein
VKVMAGNCSREVGCAVLPVFSVVQGGVFDDCARESSELDTAGSERRLDSLTGVESAELCGGGP